MPHLIPLTARTRFLLTLALLAAALLFAATGCNGGDATGSGTASVGSAAVYDNPSSTTADSSNGGSSSSGSGSHGYTGTLRGRAQMELSADGAAWVSAAPPSSVALALQSTASGTSFNTAASIPAGTYAYVRLVFSPGATATVTGTIGGTSYGAAAVTLGSGPLVIEKHVTPVTVSAGSRLTVAWDLNSELWLTPAAMSAHAVAASAIEAASWVEVR